MDAGLFAGRHVRGELYGVSPELLDDEIQLCDLLAQALTRAGATILSVSSHRFTPQGVTVLALLSESHAGIHTYPETSTCFLDIFTCGTRADPELALLLMSESLRPERMRSQTIERGLPAPAPLARINPSGALL